MVSGEWEEGSDLLPALTELLSCWSCEPTDVRTHLNKQTSMNKLMVFPTKEPIYYGRLLEQIRNENDRVAFKNMEHRTVSNLGNIT